MSLLDSLKRMAGSAIKTGVEKSVNEAKRKAATETFTFSALPQTLEDLKALPEASLDTPYNAAALTVLALCRYPDDRETGKAMLNFLKGPQPLTVREEQFLNDRFMDGKNYVPRSFLLGATPDNDYTPAAPYQLKVFANPYSFGEENYAKLFLCSGGADSERQVTLRRKGGQWFLWEQFLLSDIRKPKSSDPWA